MVPGPLSTSQSYRESSEQKDFQVTRTGAARVPLIGSEASSERGPEGSRGHRNTHHPCCLWQRLLFCQAHSTVEASHASLPLPTSPSPLTAPKARKLGSPTGTWTGSGGHLAGCSHSAVVVRAEAERSEWGVVSVAWDSSGTPGDSPPSPAQVWENGFTGALLKGLGLQCRGSC